jgi:hypothetical protein
MSVSVVIDGSIVEFTNYSFDRMLEYCYQKYGWGREDLIWAMRGSHIEGREIPNYDPMHAIYPEFDYFLVQNDGYFFGASKDICPIHCDPNTGYFCTVRKIEEEDKMTNKGFNSLTLREQETLLQQQLNIARLHAELAEYSKSGKVDIMIKCPCCNAMFAYTTEERYFKEGKVNEE